MSLWNRVRPPRWPVGALAALIGLTSSATSQAQGVARPAPGPRAQATEVAPATPPNAMFRDPFYVEVEGGASYMALLAVRGGRSVFPNMVTYSGWGPGVGVTAGLHALIFSVGVQVYMSFLDGDGTVLNTTTKTGGVAPGTFRMVATTLEGGFRLPLGRLELSMRVGVGHMFMDGFASTSSSGFPGVSANGWTVRAGLGVDVRVYRRFFVGLDVDAAVANLRRAGISGADCAGGDPFCAELQQDGDAVALMVHPHLQFGAHF